MTVTPCHICHNNQTTTTTAHNIIDNVLSRLSAVLFALSSAVCISRVPSQRLRGSFAELRTLAWQDFKVLKIHEIENDEMAKMDWKMKSMGKNLKNLSQIFWTMGGPEPPLDGVWLCQHVRVMMVRYSQDTEGEPWPGTVFAEAASVQQQKQKLRRLQYQVLKPATVTPHHRNSFKHNRSYDISGKAENEGLQSFCNHGEGYSNFTST